MILFISLIFVGHISNDESLDLDAAGNNLSTNNWSIVIIPYIIIYNYIYYLSLNYLFIHYTSKYLSVCLSVLICLMSQNIKALAISVGTYIHINKQTNHYLISHYSILILPVLQLLLVYRQLQIHCVLK